MDYCSLWFEGWWSACCMAHDAAYEAQILRSAADAELFQCVATSAPALGVVSAVVGGVMWLGVRLFGRRFYRRAGEGKA